MNPFIGYHLATSNNFPPYSQKLQEYWLAANGLFLRSHRRELEVCLQVTQTQVAGLQPLEPYFRLKVPKVPSLKTMSTRSLYASIDNLKKYYIP